MHLPGESFVHAYTSQEKGPSLTQSLFSVTMKELTTWMIVSRASVLLIQVFYKHTTFVIVPLLALGSLVAKK